MRKRWEKYANHFAFGSQNGIAESHVALLCSLREDKRDKNNYKAGNVLVRCYLRASLFRPRNEFDRVSKGRMRHLYPAA